jgi:hypothetical protein
MTRNVFVSEIYDIIGGIDMSHAIGSIILIIILIIRISRYVRNYLYRFLFSLRVSR